ncbi:MAG: hypothetical protein K2L05_00670 [Muribaculaceae bacterium]|nr:hypothetical protein [Muribaculaceae bacterium]
MIKRYAIVLILLILGCVLPLNAKPLISIDLPYDTVIGLEIAPGFSYSKELEKKARKGDIRAMINLADNYFIGNGVHKNAKEAAEIYEKVTKIKELDSPKLEEAYRKWARCYYDWEGVEKNHNKILKIYEKGLKSGILPIGRTLLKIYESGASDSPKYNAAITRAKLVELGDITYLPRVIKACITGDDGIQPNPDAALSYIKHLKNTPDSRESMNEIIRIGRNKAGSLSRGSMNSSLPLYEIAWRRCYIDDTDIKASIKKEYENFTANGIQANLYSKCDSKSIFFNLKDAVILVILFGAPDDYAEKLSHGYGEDNQKLLTDLWNLWLEYDPSGMINYAKIKGLDIFPELKDILRAYIYTPEGKVYKNTVESILRSK